MTVEDIDQQIEKLKNIRMIIQQHITPEDSMKTIIYKKYIELENITNVMKYVNEQGHYKVSKGKLLKYTITDISDTLKDKEVGVKEEIKHLAKEIFNRHKKGGKRRW